MEKKREEDKAHRKEVHKGRREVLTRKEEEKEKKLIERKRGSKTWKKGVLTSKDEWENEKETERKRQTKKGGRKDRPKSLNQSLNPSSTLSPPPLV